MLKYQQENFPSSTTDVERTKQHQTVAHFSSCDYPFYNVVYVHPSEKNISKSSQFKILCPKNKCKATSREYV